MLNTSEIITIVKKQLAVDFNCQLEDFDKTENIITFPGLNEERRKFSDKPSIFKMLTLGRKGKGVGTGLVYLLKNEISNRGKIPYYGTSSSNIHSWKIALNCGFYPVWIEAGSKD